MLFFVMAIRKLAQEAHAHAVGVEKFAFNFFLAALHDYFKRANAFKAASL